MHLPLQLYTFIKQSFGHGAQPSQTQSLPRPLKHARLVQGLPRMTSRDTEIALEVPAMVCYLATSVFS